MTHVHSPEKYKMIHVDDFGASPNSGLDASLPLQRALEAAAAFSCPVILRFGRGHYDLFPDKAVKVPCYVSNTASEAENPDVTKTVGLYISKMKNLTVEGDGTMLILHGKMTPMIIDQCIRIVIRNIKIDFERPTMSEATVVAAGENFLDLKVNQDSWYKIENGALVWIGEGWRYTDGPSQEYDPVTDITWRIPNPAASAHLIEEIAPNLLRFHFAKRFDTCPGHVFHVRDGIRDQVGTFIVRSSNVTFKNVGFHYMHGLGIVGQYSENLHFEGLLCEPRPETGRTMAAFADFMHLSGCRGKVTLLNSRFCGAHDDPINIHGTHLEIIDKPLPDRILVRFRHPQTYGFEAFQPGDEADFINADSLTVSWSCPVKAVEMINRRESLLVFDESIPENIGAGHAVENATWTPEVEIRGNHFARVPTRGILVSTRRKVVIEDNVFCNMVMSGILIADDAKSWYESGKVTDVLVRKNRFFQCGMPVVCIAPENTDVRADHPVHQNIAIEDNEFIVSDNPLLHRFRTAEGRVLYAKSTKGLRFIGNTIKAENDIKDDPAIPAVFFEACSEVEIRDNRFLGIKDSIQCRSMPMSDGVKNP